jgi:glycosyltransferase involved in cell wall biosynthesis
MAFGIERNAMKPMTIGVAIITYNGLKFLPEQLASILSQSRPVDHIVVSDDRSTDGTWEFLQSWSQSVPVRVTLIRNDAQLGLGANFEQSVAAMETDIIFTSDQDDVWVPDRVARLMQVFERHPAVLLVHTDATLVDAQGADLGTTLLGELQLSSAERAAIHAGHAFQVYCRRNVVTGATVAIRRSLLDLARPFPRTVYHDAWLALLAAAAGEVRLLDTPTIHYRQHANNLVGVKKLSAWMKLRHVIWQLRGPAELSLTIGKNHASHRDLYERLLAHPGIAPQALAFALQSMNFYSGRASLPQQALGRVGAVLKAMLAGQYGKFSYAPRTDMIRDLLKK